LRGGGGGGVGGAGGWTGFATGFATFWGTTGGFADLAVLGLDGFRAARRAAAGRLALRAGVREGVRVFLVTRRDLAIGITVGPASLHADPVGQ
jgi:hypothetical protein